MKLASKFILIITIILNFQVQSKSFVKVLLAENSQHNSIVWDFESTQKFSLTAPSSGLTNKKDFNSLKVEIIHDKIYLNGKRCKYPKIRLNPSESPIAVNGKQYHGAFIISKYHQTVLLINQVEIEDYLCSVLKTESWPGWPKEVNKAFAIASRSYVLAQVLRARKSALPYHIKNSNHHQTYSGIHNEAVLKAAVLETKDIILGHNGEPILAMFDCCCGGVIPAHITGFDFVNHPYLARTTRCDHCKLVKIYSWQASYSDHDFKKALKSAVPSLKTIKKINTKKDKAGTVKTLFVHGHKEVHQIDARTMYALFKDIKSWSYSINYNANMITVNGNGFGHHLGICQWGAREMINKGYNYREILQFYYPGAKFMKFKGYKKDAQL